MSTLLDFEKPILELEAKIEELRAVQAGGGEVQVDEEISRLEAKAAATLKELYGELTPWQKTQVARHPQRPHCLDFIGAMIEDFVAAALRCRVDALQGAYPGLAVSELGGRLRVLGHAEVPETSTIRVSTVLGGAG